MTRLYILNLKDADDLAFYQYLTSLEINIIPMNEQNNITDGIEDTGLHECINLPETDNKKRRIGNTTFIVSSKFNNGEPSDIVSKIVRLIQYDIENMPYIYGLNGGIVNG